MSAAPIISGITKLPKPAKHRDDDQEDHQRRVVRDQDVERLRVEVLRSRLGQLGAEEHRQDSPPTTKKKIVVTRYWIPITLWSVFGRK